ncbi:hypothetical protein ACSMXM_03885 [Pacificimonas sp. ICDLI1SI03]
MVDPARKSQHLTKLFEMDADKRVRYWSQKNPWRILPNDTLRLKNVKIAYSDIETDGRGNVKRMPANAEYRPCFGEIVCYLRFPQEEIRIVMGRPQVKKLDAVDAIPSMRAGF